jgi:Domain of unknown function (DUF427)
MTNRHGRASLGVQAAGPRWPGCNAARTEQTDRYPPGEGAAGGAEAGQGPAAGSRRWRDRRRFRAAQVLFETGLPPRFCLPIADVRLDLLRLSATQTHCPYKGTASYWSVQAGAGVHRDLAWIYRTPLPESQKIAGLACFYNEKVDLYVDGVLQDRPTTKFS